MFSNLAFFSFVELADRSLHGEYNRWHQLDHRPENLALPGVLWGDRWARAEKPETAEQDGFNGTDFVAMYWFKDPAGQSVEQWDRLGENSFQWGRGPLIPGVQRRMLAFFTPVKGYAAPRILIGPEVLPYRPNQGVHIRVTRYPQPHSQQAHQEFAFEDRVLMPKLLEVDQVAGGWTFSFSHAQQHSTLPFPKTVEDEPGQLRLQLLYLDGNPEAAAEGIRAVHAQLKSGEAAPPAAGELVFESVCKTIIPWRDW